jgi:transcriptional regulator with XRE-family HTH domain
LTELASRTGKPQDISETTLQVYEQAKSEGRSPDISELDESEKLYQFAVQHWAEQEAGEAEDGVNLEKKCDSLEKTFHLLIEKIKSEKSNADEKIKHQQMLAEMEAMVADLVRLAETSSNE